MLHVDQVKLDGMARVQHFLKELEANTNAFEIEANFYAILVVADNAYRELRKINKGFTL